jgi:dTDP-4-dehydrorhamnose reductase
MLWITGAGGLIGHHLVQTAPQFAPVRQVRGLARAELDLLDFDAVRRTFREERPQVVVHCAALSRNPTCQADPSLAHRLNVEVTALLAELTADIPFVFFSTDLVFDGRAGNYDESAPVNPLSVYAETKAKAEQIVLSNPRHTVIRTALNVGVSPTGDHAFNEQMKMAWRRDETLHLFVDEYRCPLPVQVTVRATWELISQQRTGLYHVGGAERLSRWEIGKLIAARCPELNPRLEPASAKDYFTTPRPADVSLNSEKVQKLLPFSLPKLSEWLAANPQELI